MGLTTVSPLLTLTNGKHLLDFYSLGITSLGETLPTWGVASIAGLSALLALINIFLYKKRKVQMKIGTLTSVLILFFYVTVFIYFYSYSGKHDLSFSGVQYGIILPFVALVFNILATLRIKKDENLVKSLDRIR